MAPTGPRADDRRARRLLARGPAVARITAVVLTGLAAAACGTLHAATLQSDGSNPLIVATARAMATTAAGGSPSAAGKHTAKPSARPSKTASPSDTATHTAKPSASLGPSKTASSGTRTQPASDPGTATQPAPSHTPAPSRTPTPAPTHAPTSSSSCQQSFEPSYFYSGALWDQAIGTKPAPSVMFLNVDNGVGTAPDSHFQALVKSAQQHGITVLGYSSTEYTGRPIAQVEAEISDYKAWYGVNGIMLDLTEGTAAALPYYRTLYNYIHSKIPGAVIWLNVGAFPVSSFMSVANVVTVFEGSYSSFESDSVPSWVSQYGRDRFAQVVYDTPKADLATVVKQSWSRRAGNLFVTDLGEPNPYGALPSYWPTEAATVAAQC